MWSELLKRFLGVALLRTSPADVPRSNGLLISLLVVHCLMDLIAWSMLEGIGLGPMLGRIAIDYAVFFLFLQLVLEWNQQRERFNQCANALLGAGLFVSLLNFIPYSLLPAQESADAAVPLMIFWQLLLLWRVLQIAYVLRCATGILMLGTFMMAVAYIFFTMALIAIVFPVPAS